MRERVETSSAKSEKGQTIRKAVVLIFSFQTTVAPGRGGGGLAGTTGESGSQPRGGLPSPGRREELKDGERGERGIMIQNLDRRIF